MDKIWTGKRYSTWSGYVHPCEPSILHHNGSFYVQRRYIGFQYTASWWRHMFLHDNAGHEIEMQTETEKIEKDRAVSYMANHGSTLEDAIQIMENL